MPAATSRAVGGERGRAMESAAPVDVRDDLGRLVQHVRGDVLHRRGRARPDLAGQSEQCLARRAAGRALRKADEADPPAAERHVLAQPARDVGPFGEVLGRAADLAGLVREIAVDLVRDDAEAVLLGDLD